MTENEMLSYVMSRIRQIRIAKDISQMELAATADIAQSFLAKLESGKQKPSLLTIIKIAKALDVPPTAFFPEEHITSKESIKSQIVKLLDSL